MQIVANLENDDDCKRIVDEHVKKFGRIDVLVNNASKQITCKNIADIEPENVRSTFHSNITGKRFLNNRANYRYGLPRRARCRWTYAVTITFTDGLR